MIWQQLTFAISCDQAEPFSDLLQDYGALAVTFKDGADQPLFEPPVGEHPLWNHTLVTALYEDHTEIPALITTLTLAWLPQQLPEYQLQTLPEQVWERSWMAGFTPLCFGKRLWIVPSWYQPPEAAAVNLLLDPGIAFGTGTHPTTRLCLEWLDGADVNGKTVIDYGCGSGVLALAALLLGAAQVYGVDTDPQALAATLENGRRNQVAARLQVSHPDLTQESPQVPLLLANILSAPLITLAPYFAKRVVPAGEIVLSGILSEQWQAVAAAYQPYFVLQPPTFLEGWVRLAGQRHHH
ncbi:MAG: 50S ribosomal protein L11 methyltransferase [Gammaproteobacteria bacterium]|nr:50S ribosomal protein L11 methyltransferase [Gammaproteobacteria bacterium]